MNYLTKVKPAHRDVYWGCALSGVSPEKTDSEGSGSSYGEGRLEVDQEDKSQSPSLTSNTETVRTDMTSLIDKPSNSSADMSNITTNRFDTDPRAIHRSIPLHGPPAPVCLWRKKDTVVQDLHPTVQFSTSPKALGAVEKRCQFPDLSKPTRDKFPKGGDDPFPHW